MANGGYQSTLPGFSRHDNRPFFALVNEGFSAIEADAAFAALASVAFEAVLGEDRSDPVFEKGVILPGRPRANAECDQDESQGVVERTWSFGRIASHAKGIVSLCRRLT
jgi:hypothetical protein